MDTPQIIPPPDDDFEPAPPSARGRRRPWLASGVLMLATAAALLGAAGWAPAFHLARRPAGGPLEGREPVAAEAAAEQGSRRLVTTVSALHADFLRVGRWEASFAERDVNAWLAIDLPRNHASALPAAVSEPRVEFLPGRLRAGVRVGRGILSATAWVETDVALRDANQLGIRLVTARLGGLPLPRGPILREIARRLERFGAVVENRGSRDPGLLVVYIPSTHAAGGLSHWLEAVRLDAGVVTVAGETREAAARFGGGL